jgi:4-hydroxy-3-polyprenylbenzoate decarboxylase
LIRRLIVSLTGASGAVYGVRLLEVLREMGIETHVVITSAAAANLKIEKSMRAADILKLCTKIYDENDVGASIASGSYVTQGMIIVPCSMHTLAGIAHGASDNLVLRAADVCLKERRKLVLVPRETPLSLVHLRNMTLAAEAGAIVLPAMPGFYYQPRSIEDMINFIVGRVLDSFGIEHSLFRRWAGNEAARS